MNGAAIEHAAVCGFAPVTLTRRLVRRIGGGYA